MYATLAGASNVGTHICHLAATKGSLFPAKVTISLVYQVGWTIEDAREARGHEGEDLECDSSL